MLPLPNAASVAIFDADRVLLVARNRPPFRDHWTLPGGRLEPGETAAAAAAREILEELGLVVGRLCPVLRFDALAPAPAGHPGFILEVFVTRFIPAPIAPSDEIAAFGWYAPTDLVALRTTPGLAAILARARAMLDAC